MATTESERTQLTTYTNQIQDLLSHVKADIQQYKFLIEKKDDGLAIDIAFKATITSEEEEEKPSSTMSGP